jgi:hypothetical protein
MERYGITSLLIVVAVQCCYTRLQTTAAPRSEAAHLGTLTKRHADAPAAETVSCTGASAASDWAQVQQYFPRTQISGVLMLRGGGTHDGRRKKARKAAQRDAEREAREKARNVLIQRKLPPPDGRCEILYLHSLFHAWIVWGAPLRLET